VLFQTTTSLKLKFSKRALENYHNPLHGFFESCIVYGVYSNETIVGTFLLGEKAGYIDFEQTFLTIDIAHNVFKRDRYEIVERNSATSIGEYRIARHLDGTMLLGSLILKGKEYVATKLKSEVIGSFLKKEARGHYKLRLSNADEEVVYQFKVEVPLIAIANRSQKPFDGEIQLNSTNLMTVFCGLFIIEQILNIENDWNF
jgi:hypothetical protein